jgi:hypothetical protein
MKVGMGGTSTSLSVTKGLSPHKARRQREVFEEASRIQEFKDSIQEFADT